MFQTDQVITEEEIGLFVQELNKWTKIYYPAFQLKYSGNPDAKQTEGLVALKGIDRIIALLSSKMLSAGAKATGLTYGYQAKESSVLYAIDQIRLAAYPETGEEEPYTKIGNLNNTPGALFINLIEGGARVPSDNTSQPSVDGRLAIIEKRWPGLLDKLAS